MYDCVLIVEVKFGITRLMQLIAEVVIDLMTQNYLFNYNIDQTA